MNKLELSISSEIVNIKKVESFIEYFMDEFQIQEKLRGKIALSIVEAVNNAIISGNKQNPQKMVKLKAIKNTKRVIITIEDEGEGFDFKQIPDPTTPERLMQTTGRGLYLIVNLTDELLFAKNGAKVIMSFFLNQPF